MYYALQELFGHIDKEARRELPGPVHVQPDLAPPLPSTPPAAGAPPAQEQPPGEQKPPAK